MEGLKVAVVRILGIVLSLCAFVMCCFAQEVSVACMMAYDEGGAPAVFSSEECTQWEWTRPIHSPEYHPTSNCELAAATLQGHRPYQEDRIACNPAMRIPFLGKEGPEEVKIGVAAVFDGHGGAEASELAFKKFLDYLYLNTLFNTHKLAFSHNNDNDEINNHISSTESSGRTSSFFVDDTSFYHILKGALIRTFRDIDSEFTQDALKNNYHSGSTGTVALLLNGRVLVVYVGDSKALLCSDRSHAVQGAQDSSVRAHSAEELTVDHHPDREDEKARIEAAGGFVCTWDVPRVNGMLAMSRSIGDLNLKRYGVIAEPEVIGWRTITSGDRFLVIGSDGVFEGLTPSNVCAALHNNACTPGSISSISSSCLSPSALANHIVNSAFENGSSDNISIIVIPLEPAYSSQ